MDVESVVAAAPGGVGQRVWGMAQAGGDGVAREGAGGEMDEPAVRRSRGEGFGGEVVVDLPGKEE